MARDEEVQFEQDHLGNERRKLDQLRAQEGMAGTDASDRGIEEVGTADTGSSLTVYSIPTHADQVILDLIHAHNSASTQGAFTVQEVSLDSSGSITGSVRRSVPIVVDSNSTREIDYKGESFERAIGVDSEFAGVIGVAVYSDHKEYVEGASEQQT